MKTTCWCQNPNAAHSHVTVRYDAMECHGEGAAAMLTTTQWYNLAKLLYKLGITVIY